MRIHAALILMLGITVFTGLPAADKVGQVSGEMKNAVGSEISVKPMLQAVDRALNVLGR